MLLIPKTSTKTVGFLVKILIENYFAFEKHFEHITCLLKVRSVAVRISVDYDDRR